MSNILWKVQPNHSFAKYILLESTLIFIHDLLSRHLRIPLAGYWRWNIDMVFIGKVHSLDINGCITFCVNRTRAYCIIKTCLGSERIIPTPYKLRINYLSYWYFFFSFSLLLCSLYKKLIIIRDAKDSWSNVTCNT